MNPLAPASLVLTVERASPPCLEVPVRDMTATSPSFPLKGGCTKSVRTFSRVVFMFRPSRVSSARKKVRDRSEKTDALALSLRP